MVCIKGTIKSNRNLILIKIIIPRKDIFLVKAEDDLLFHISFSFYLYAVIDRGDDHGYNQTK